MNNLIEVINDRCVGCSACVRVCPSPEANIVKIPRTAGPSWK